MSPRTAIGADGRPGLLGERWVVVLVTDSGLEYADRSVFLTRESAEEELEKVRDLHKQYGDDGRGGAAPRGRGWRPSRVAQIELREIDPDARAVPRGSAR